MVPHKWVYWGFVGLWGVFLLFFLFYAPTAAQFPETYQLAPTGTLQSRLWSFHFWVTSLFVVLWLIPLTLAFAIDDTKGTMRDDGTPIFPRQVFHIVVSILVLLWIFSSFVVESTYLGTANVGTVENAWNPANDKRWCCVYYLAAPSACYVNAPCSVPVGASNLAIDRDFIYQWSFHLVTILLLIATLVLVLCVMRPAYTSAALDIRDPLVEPLKAMATKRYKGRQ
jgi:hypothetical protein